MKASDINKATRLLQARDMLRMNDDPQFTQVWMVSRAHGAAQGVPPETLPISEARLRQAIEEELRDVEVALLELGVEVDQ